MNWMNRAALVTLRIAIGFYFLMQGLHKVHTVYAEPTDGHRPWTGEPFFREARGPLGPYLRRELGDPDDATLALFDVSAGNLPTPLADRWNAYFNGLVRHYNLTDEQRKTLDARFAQAKDKTLRWLTGEPEKVNRTYGTAAIAVDLTVPKRIAEYRALVEQVRALDAKVKSTEDVEWPHLRALKTDLTRTRADLQGDVEKQTNQMKSALRETLETGKDALSDEQRARGAYDEPKPSRGQIDRFDWATRWGLVLVGSLLLVGLFSRIACLGAALFLLSIYLSAPPFPWLPAGPMSVPGEVYVDKNLVMCLALVALATVPTGRWLGLDAILWYTIGRPLFGRARPAAELPGRIDAFPMRRP